MIIRIIVFISFFSILHLSKAADIIKVNPNAFRLSLESQVNMKVLQNDSTITHIPKFKRGKAIIFAVLTGFLGGHRVYFGTHQRTPIIYSITLGGLGVLALVDLVHIIFAKDLSKFENKSQIIMWGK